MNRAALATSRTGPTLQRYRDNFPRHLLGVALYLQSSTMQSLSTECGHRHLRINFEPYIALVGPDGTRLSDIADILGVSRQAANQTVNQIEQAGYLRRRADPSDGRAKLLTLSGRGRQLRADGARTAGALQQQFAGIIGEQALGSSIVTLGRLVKGLELLQLPPAEPEFAGHAELGALLPRLSQYISHRLMELTMRRGHRDLKLSFGQVLTRIGPHGGRIQHMAETQGVSKQAISAVATELETLGYIRRDPDPADARQRVLQFTARGLHLISDSVASVDDLEREFSALVGQDALAGLQVAMRSLYRSLHLEQEVFEPGSGAVDMQLLAGQLIQQLGDEGARVLGRLLLNQQETRG